MKKVIIVITFAIYIASIAVVNFFGLEIAIFEGFTYVNEIEITNLTVINGGDMYEITPYESVVDENGIEVLKFRFEYKDVDGEVNPNMVKIDYAIRPDNADNKAVDFIYDEASLVDVMVFHKDLQTVEFLKANRSVSITIATTDGHNIKKRIQILCYRPKK